jgi:SAM-dependent methyltransferase
MERKARSVSSQPGTQEASRSWWSSHPMNYDAHRTLTHVEGTKEYFDEVDGRFLASALFPFDDLLPLNSLAGLEVLEIGCGAGLHAQWMMEAGAHLTAIDITPKAVALTRRRLELRGLDANVLVMDAEELALPANSVDFVWSWGVIHHSRRTDAIVREIRRVLRPDGEFRCMVYHHPSIWGSVSVVRGVLSGKAFAGMSPRDMMSYYADGYQARFYTAREFRDVLGEAGFRRARISLLGQKNELVPMPRGRLKDRLVDLIPDTVARRILSRAGSFLFSQAQ